MKLRTLVVVVLFVCVHSGTATTVSTHNGKCSHFKADSRSAIQNPTSKYYVACRFNYSRIALRMGIRKSEVKKFLREECVAVVTSRESGKTVVAQIADWGPHVRTGRAVDMSVQLMHELKIETDDRVECKIIRKDQDSKCQSSLLPENVSSRQ